MLNNKVSMDGLRKCYSEYKHCLVWNGSPSDERKLTSGDIRSLLGLSSAWMLRNIYDWDCGFETNFWEVICDQCHSIETLPSKTRNQIRRSLRDCDIRQITAKEFVEANGFEVYKKSFERYHDVTVHIMNREQWESTILEHCDRYEYWGVFVKETGRLIAYGMNSIKGNGVNYNTLKAIPEFMNKHYPYYGLLFQMNGYYLGERGFRYVSDGFRSITEHSNIQPFLEKNFYFRKAYCKMRIYYKPWLKTCISIAYPFRKFLGNKSIKHLLNQEEISRGK